MAVRIPKPDALEADETAENRGQAPRARKVIPVMSNDKKERRAEQQYAKGAQGEGEATAGDIFFGVAGENLVPLSGGQ